MPGGDIRVGTYVEEAPTIFNQGLFEISATKKHDLGTPRMLSDGRCFVYSQAGGTALVAGRLNQATVPLANHINETVAAAAAVGDRKVQLTLGATLATINQYAEGYLSIQDEAGEGHYYKIKTHPAADSAAALWVTLYDAVRFALTTASEYSLIKNQYDAVIIHPSPPTAQPVCVSVVAVTALYYYWGQKEGPCTVLADGTLVIGNKCRPSEDDDGAVAAQDYDEADVANNGSCGWVMDIAADGEHALIDLRL